MYHISNWVYRFRALKYHIEGVHEGKKPHKCTVCEKGFTLPGDLTKHIKQTHDKVKPNEYSLYEAKFRVPNLLRTHSKGIHEEKKENKYTICKLEFSLPGELRKHIKQVHEIEKSYKCDLWREEFSRNDNFRFTLWKRGVYMPFAIWGYTDGAGGTGLMWVYPPKNVFEFPRGKFK